MGPSATETLDSDGRDSTSGVQLSKDGSEEEQKQDGKRLRTGTLYCYYFTLFVDALATTITYSSLWSYLKTMDVETTTWYLGFVHAAFNGGELCCMLLYGLWVQYRAAIEPLSCSLIALIIGSALYAWSYSFGYYGKFTVLVARMLVGCYTGNDIIVTVLLCEQTTLSERTSAMAYISLSHALGFIVGPVIQSCFVPLGEKGIYLKGIFLGINMYTMAGIFCVFLGIINLAAAWRYVTDNNRAMEKHSDSEDQYLLEDKNGAPKETVKKDENSTKRELPDIVAVVTVLILYFFVKHILVYIEVVLSPMAMDLYALSDEDTLSYVGVMLTIIGLSSIFVFIVTEKLAPWTGDRPLMLVSAIFGLLGFAVLWPGSNTYPKLGHFYTAAINTTHGIRYVKKVTQGCSPFHSWCKTTPVITIPQIVFSAIFLVISFPISYMILPSLYSKIIKPGRQGIMLSLLNLSGNLSRISGPSVFTTIYSYYGPKLLILTMDVGLSISLLLSIVFYKKLIPYNDFIRNIKGRLNDT